MLRLIGIDGDKGAGKDTLAEVLVKRFGFTRLPFAKPLKDMLSEIFLLAPITFEDRVIKDQPFAKSIELTAYHIQRILDYLELCGIKISDQAVKSSLQLAGTSLTSPRHMMQFIGTELVRQRVNQETWVILWCKEQAKYSKVVAPDARMPNERDAITVRMGKNVFVKRPGTGGDSHVSENNHGKESDYDAIATNNTDIFTLQSDFAMWYTIVKDK